MKAILANWLVCIAAFMAGSETDLAGKLLGCWFPISAFVMCGFEHSIANMYLIPIGLTAGASGDLMDMIANLLPVTLGNIVGGAGGVALAYRLAYGSQAGGSAS